jgi:hippurate hydrolase
MPILNRVSAFADELTAWRRDIHTHPELSGEEVRTPALVAERLKAFGCDEVVTGIGKTGVVARIKGNRPGAKVIGLRADMDALPIDEATGRPYASIAAGKMHACGHDGHTTMLLGAARYLAETRNFAGEAVLIFQPAEESGVGARAMIADGLMERFGITEVYGMHNMPGVPVGQFAIRPGSIMAAADWFTVEIEGKGSHAARPNESIDTLYVAALTVTALQAIVARNVDPIDSAILSVTQISAGNTFNVIPQTATLKGTIRSFDTKVRDLVHARFAEIVNGVAAMHGARAVIDIRQGSTATVNHDEQTLLAAEAAAGIVGETLVDQAVVPCTASEDFGLMLEARPGAFIFIGNGDSAGLHHPKYDFDDASLPIGASYWARLVETASAR